MNRYVFSDLAFECGETETHESLRNGFRVSRGVYRNAPVTSIRITSSSIHTDMQKRLAAKAVSAELTELIPHGILRSNAPVTVICLGNPSFTADSLGSVCARTLVATRAIKAENEAAFDALGGREISVITPGVAGHSGIEPYEVLRACRELLRPSLVIAIDSLRAASAESLSAVIQLSAAGIAPGSGVGNSRREISEKTLGVPVISIGSPTAISSSTLVFDALKKAGMTSPSAPVTEILENGRNFLVSSNCLDSAIKLHADVIAKAINLTFLGFAEI